MQNGHKSKFFEILQDYQAKSDNKLAQIDDSILRLCHSIDSLTKTNDATNDILKAQLDKKDTKVPMSFVYWMCAVVAAAVAGGKYLDKVLGL